MKLKRTVEGEVHIYNLRAQLFTSSSLNVQLKYLICLDGDSLVPTKRPSPQPYDNFHSPPMVAAGWVDYENYPHMVA